MAPLLFLLQTPLDLSQANTSRSIMEAGRPGELHKKRLSRFDRRNLLKRHDLRGSLRWKRGQRSSSSSGFDDQQSLRHVLKADNLRVAQGRLSPLRPAGVLIMSTEQFREPAYRVQFSPCGVITRKSAVRYGRRRAR